MEKICIIILLLQYNFVRAKLSANYDCDEVQTRVLIWKTLAFHIKVRKNAESFIFLHNVNNNII